MSDERKHENQVRVERLARIGRSYELSDLDGDRVTVVNHRGRVDLIIRSSDDRGLEVVATLSDEQARLLALSLCRVYELSVVESRSPCGANAPTCGARRDPDAPDGREGKPLAPYRDDIRDRREQRCTSALQARHPRPTTALAQW
jgi:hypothetical protein